MFWLGLIYFPADFLDREQAITVARRSLTVGNREILLAVLCLICLLRLAYLDVRRALSDADYPPVREKLIRGLALFFSSDRRQAEFRKIADDSELMRLRAKAEAEKIENRQDAQRAFKEIDGYLERLGAEHKLVIFDTLPKAHRMFPPKDGDWSTFEMSLPDVDNGFLAAISPEHVSVLLPNLADNLRAAQKSISVAYPRPEEEGVSWPSDRLRFRWLNLMSRADAYEKTVAEERKRLEGHTNQAGRAILVERIRRLLPQDTERGTPQ